ncbi:THAP domain-containing protein 6-like [Odontomachus brunneus]|uniref:THAP domain-containing protein 6-like n=1 Tax=Odontomachus brunneus TaxID=486640 RepID=UPI0013F25269|nr:THAP domain-containing protein 6-like [Odontomachus brunneus]XP_032670086.1 THAP domain-containing protein 6-like [Odontomachus brunneus]XP_032670087.1 THAP domain-containing protein 6-like [Odontomachus brunneus]
MPSNCTAFNCCNRSDEGYALFRYPQDETMKRKWIVMVGRGKNWSPSSSQKLCEVHFKPAEIEFFAGRKRVKLGSVPSRFCSCSSGDSKNNHRKLRKNAEYRNSLYKQQVSIREHNNCCIVMQPPLRKNDILAVQQEEFIEKVRKENAALRTVVFLLQNILQNRAQ